MRKRLLFLVFVVAATSIATAGETIDRVVATVNGHAILESDWEDAIRYEAFMNGRPFANITVVERKAALDHLIDQELLREQMHASDTQQALSEEEAGKRIEEIRKQYASLDQHSWSTLLAQYHLSEDELRRRVVQQLNLTRLVDDRLRPTIQIDSKSIENYYQQSLLPQLRQSGAREVPLSAVSPRIKEVLTLQKLDELLGAWLEYLRASSEIHGGGSSQGADR